jgi:hypothetical protein
VLHARVPAGGRKLAAAGLIAGLAAVTVAAGSPAAAATTFTITPTPNPSAVLDTLNAVSSRTATDAWAVGQVGEIGNAEANGGLALHWDGATWTSTPVPVTRFRNETLTGVSAVAGNDAWAVGGLATAQNQLPKVPLAVHWDGTAWTSIPIPTGPNPGGTGRGGLRGVVALAGNDVWAVGRSPGLTAIIEHWDGTSWTLAPIPTINLGLDSIAAVSPKDIWATGDPFSNADGTKTALIMHYDGVAWKQVTNQVSVPSTSSHSGLVSVTAAAGNDVWALGFAADALGNGGPLLQHWNGSVWSQVAAPANPKNSTGLGLSALAAVGHDDLYAVGTFGRSDIDETDSYLAHWNGTAWTQLPVQHTAFPTDGLNAVAVTPASGGGTTGSPVWGVGTSVHPGQCCGIQLDTTLAVVG